MAAWYAKLRPAKREHYIPQAKPAQMSLFMGELVVTLPAKQLPDLDLSTREGRAELLRVVREANGVAS